MCIVYIDDVIVFSNNFKDHLEHLKIVFDRLRENQFVAKPEKCTFCCDELEFLGHVVSNEGIKTDPKKIEKIKNAAAPQNVKELRAFPVLASYYRRFVHNYAKIAHPLTYLTGDVPYLWTEDQEHAFQELKNRLVSTPILAYPQYDIPFEIHTDASNIAISGVLVQKQDGQEKVIAYASRTLSPPEKNYSVTERECLAVHHFINHYECYLDKPFTVITDHDALVWLFKKEQVKGRLARWILSLQQHTFTIKHQAGKNHEVYSWDSRKD